MVEISCFYIHYNREPINMTFIKYDKFIKIFLDSKRIIISFNTLVKNNILYRYYILSLLCTKDSSKIEYFRNNGNLYRYGINTEVLWKNMYFTGYYEIIELDYKSHKNPFNTQEPKRESSLKKQKKLLKQILNLYFHDCIDDPMILIDNYINQLIERERIKINKIHRYESTIYILCKIKTLGNDIYENIMKFM